MHTPLHHTQRWYFGRIRRVDAEELLMKRFNQYGSYLVRESERTPGNFSLSIRDTERVRHYRIERLENGTFFVTRRVTFETLQNLVAYYQQQAKKNSRIILPLAIPSERCS